SKQWLRITWHRRPDSDDCYITGRWVEACLLQSRHNLFFEEIERIDHFVKGEIADVEHTHEMFGADLFHLTLNLIRHAVGISRDQIAGAAQAIIVELGKITSLAVAFAEVVEGQRHSQGSRQTQ